MEQTVYVDLFFIINFSMDFLCFFLASSLLSHKFCLWRTVLASALGGAYACAALFIPVRGIWGVIIDIAACAVISAVAVKKKGNLKDVGVYALVFTACSILLGGFMTVLFSFFNKIGLDRLMGTEEDGDGLSVWLFALLALAGALLSFFGGRFFKKRGSRKECRLELTLNKKSVELVALCDSGNLLADPMTSKPCIVADILSVEEILPEDIARFIRSGGKADMGDPSVKLRVIPTRTVSGSGLLYAIGFDRVRLNMGKGWCDIDALVAFSDIGGSADGAKALVPSVFAIGAP